MVEAVKKFIFATAMLVELLACQSSTLKKNLYEDATPQEFQTFKKSDLPFSPGTEFKISQGAFGCCTHNIRGFEYSWDFDVPYGTEIRAVEAGTVVQVWEPNKGGGCDIKFNEVAHNIKIEGSDGTIAQYAHTKSKVHIGERIEAGQVIGVTANNGFHCVPQLHFNFFRDKVHMPENKKPETIPIYFNRMPDGVAREGLKMVVPRPRPLNDRINFLQQESSYIE